jgi:crossover junction endodeoxyribonuclease RusA
MTLQFKVFGVPAPQGSSRGFLHRSTGRVIVTHDNPRTEPWRESVAWAALRAMREQDWPQAQGAVNVAAVFRLPRPQSLPRRVKDQTRKPDLDKLLRALLDALSQASVWRDDAQVVSVHAGKRYVADGEAPGVDVSVLRES